MSGTRDRLPEASSAPRVGVRAVVECVKYKSELHGIDVAVVDPENTSRRCSHCGFTHPDNRDSEAFVCLKCGYENHADYNAAKNRYCEYIHRGQKSRGGWATSQLALKSGMLNVNGEYTPSALRG